MIADGTPGQIRRAVRDSVVVTLGLTGVGAEGVSNLSSKFRLITGINTVSTTIVGLESRFQIEGTRDLDYARLFELVNNEGAKVASMEASEPSLEEAFLSIVGEP